MTFWRANDDRVTKDPDKCIYCGKPRMENVRYCAKCGAEIMRFFAKVKERHDEQDVRKRLKQQVSREE